MVTHPALDARSDATTGGPLDASYTAFAGPRCVERGPLAKVALAAAAARRGGADAVLVFDDATGAVVDLDLRGTFAALKARFGALPRASSSSSSSGPDRSATPGVSEAAAAAPAAPRSRGRPSLGVVAREVTLLPRHWEWLASQPGGASVALRKLVDEARRLHAERDHARQLRERAYRFMAAIAGDLPGFEEATRALFAGDRAGFDARTAAWPHDIRSHAARLAWDAVELPSAALPQARPPTRSPSKKARP